MNLSRSQTQLSKATLLMKLQRVLGQRQTTKLSKATLLVSGSKGRDCSRAYRDLTNFWAHVTDVGWISWIFVSIKGPSRN